MSNVSWRINNERIREVDDTLTILNELTYVEQLQADYTRIRTATRAGTITREERFAQIDEAVGRYALAHADAYAVLKEKGGVIPINYKNDRMLDAFADLALYEDLTWDHADKMSVIEFPIMSERQARRRAAKTSMPGEIEHKGRQNNGRRSLVYSDKTDTIRSTKPRMQSADESGIDGLTANIDLNNALDGAGLTDRQRQALDLVYFDGLTQEVAATEMGVSRQAVDLYARNAIDKLRAQMTKV